MQKAQLIGLVVLFAAPMVTYADPPGTRILRGYRLTGTAYSNIRTNQFECKRVCDTDPQCHAWNYVAAGEHRGSCDLLSNPGYPGYRDGWVSGIKPPPPAVKAGRDRPPPHVEGMPRADPPPPVVKRS
jgi:hypothetical protein